MANEESIADWKRMWLSLTDPEIRAENRRKADIVRRMEDKKRDTGL